MLAPGSEFADNGIGETVRVDAVMRTALNTYGGFIVHEALADSTGLPYKNLDGIELQ